MPKLSTDTKLARRDHILDAAEYCFAEAGFHQCKMQDICKRAGVSIGALYLYFKSKEELIDGIAKRHRAKFQQLFTNLSDAPDFLQALTIIAEQYFVEEPPEQRLIVVEIGAEASRNKKVSEIFRDVDQFVMKSFETLFYRLEMEGRIDPNESIETLTKLFAVIGDGMMWRRATDPSFDAKSLLPAVTRLMNALICPQDQGDTQQETL